MKGDQQNIKKATAKMGGEIKVDPARQMQATLERTTRKGASPKEVLGLTDAMVEGIYGQAYRLYNTGKYRDASALFRMLIMINPTEPKYTMGLAACNHLMKDYKSAADVYAILAVIDPHNPVSFYHASDCYIKLNDAVSAIVALEMAIKKAGVKPEYHTLKDRANLTLENLRKEIAKNK